MGAHSGAFESVLGRFLDWQKALSNSWDGESRIEPEAVGRTNGQNGVVMCVLASTLCLAVSLYLCLGPALGWTPRVNGLYDFRFSIGLW